MVKSGLSFKIVERWVKEDHSVKEVVMRSEQFWYPLWKNYCFNPFVSLEFSVSLSFFDPCNKQIGDADDLEFERRRGIVIGKGSVGGREIGRWTRSIETRIF